MTLLNEADAIYIGALQADRVYVGETLVWPSGAPPFVPTDIAGLAVWLDASQLGLADGAAMTTWPNLGSALDMSVEGSPAPTFRINALNSLPVVRCTVSCGRFRLLSSGVHKDFTLVYVGRMWSANVGRVVCAAYPSSGNMLFGYWTSYMDIAYCTGGGGFFVPDTRTATTTTWKMYSADGSTTGTYTPRFFSNGTLLGSHPTPPAIDGWAGSLNISGYGTSTEETCDCEVAELVLYDRKLSDAERAEVESYLRIKWGL